MFNRRLPRVLIKKSESRRVAKRDSGTISAFRVHGHQVVHYDLLPEQCLAARILISAPRGGTDSGRFHFAEYCTKTGPNQSNSIMRTSRTPRLRSSISERRPPWVGPGSIQGLVELVVGHSIRSVGAMISPDASLPYQVRHNQLSDHVAIHGNGLF